jgi:hypothetical protein
MLLPGNWNVGVPAAIPIDLRLSDGRQIHGETRELSFDEMFVLLVDGAVPQNACVEVVPNGEAGMIPLPAVAVRKEPDGNGLMFTQGRVDAAAIVSYIIERHLEKRA